MKVLSLTVIICIGICAESFSQNTVVEPIITFKGVVFDTKDSLSAPGPIVVNRRTGTGHAFIPGGEFSIQGFQSDTFMVIAGGYEFVRFCFADSTFKSVYSLRVGLSLKENQLNPVTIFQVKELKAIKEERQGLGVEQTRTTQGVTDAVSSPITFLYERFSREGRSKALVAELENEDRKNTILKDLFRTYNRAGVIALQESEFDSFIMFLNMPEWYLKTASDYDLAVTIKQRYQQFARARQIHDKNQH